MIVIEAKYVKLSKYTNEQTNEVYLPMNTEHNEQ